MKDENVGTDKQMHRNVAVESRQGANRRPPSLKSKARVGFTGKIRGRRSGRRG